MSFIKGNLTLLVSAAVAIAAIGFTGWGMSRASDVQQRLASIDATDRAVDGLKNSAVNSSVIAEHRAEMTHRNEETRRAQDVALAVQFSDPFNAPLNDAGQYVSKPREALIPNVLPAAPDNTVALQFRNVYKDAFDHLFTRVVAGDKPTMEEIQQVRKEQGLDEDDSGKSNELPWSPERWARTGEVERVVRELTSLEVLRTNPPSVAAYRKAYATRMYVSPKAIGRHSLVDRSDRPTDIEIWQAQMGLWIQQDLVEALARVNDKRARELEAKGQHAWVAKLPVKHLENIAIANYLGGQDGPGGESNDPEGEYQFAVSVGARQNNADMFVVPLQMTLIVEQEALPEILDSICGIGFYTPNNITYRQVAPNPTQVDYLYGSDPIIETVITFEGYFFRAVYDKWIPKRLVRILATPGCIADDIMLRPGSTRFGGGGRG